MRTAQMNHVKRTIEIVHGLSDTKFRFGQKYIQGMIMGFHLAMRDAFDLKHKEGLNCLAQLLPEKVYKEYIPEGYRADLLRQLRKLRGEQFNYSTLSLPVGNKEGP